MIQLKNIPVSVDLRNAVGGAWLRSELRKAYDLNRRLFGARPRHDIRVIVCGTFGEWKKSCRYYYFPFARGVVLRDGTIVLKDLKLSRLNRDKFRAMLRHEMNHAFWLLALGPQHSGWRPFWIAEGLACIAARDPFILSREIMARRMKGFSEKDLYYSYRASALSSRKRVRELYSLWYYFLLFITDGKKGRLVTLLRRHRKQPSRDRYLDLFTREFKASLKCLFDDFKADTLGEDR